MRRVQYYQQNGQTVKRVYTRKPGRPKGTKNSTYNLTKEGLAKKQECARKTLIKIRKSGKVGSGYFKNHEMTVEHKKKNSKGVLKAIADGRLNPVENIRKFIASGGSEKYWETRVTHGTHGMFYSKKNIASLRYDSSWELERMKFLEANDEVVSYRKNPVKIPYSLNGQAHYYFPDFMVEYANGDRVLEEIKPKALIPLSNNKLKIKAAKIFCRALGLEFRILTCVESLSS